MWRREGERERERAREGGWGGRERGLGREGEEVYSLNSCTSFLVLQRRQQKMKDITKQPRVPITPKSNPRMAGIIFLQ
jgi:hypothetical protein